MFDKMSHLWATLARLGKGKGCIFLANRKRELMTMLEDLIFALALLAETELSKASIIGVGTVRLFL